MGIHRNLPRLLWCFWKGTTFISTDAWCQETSTSTAWHLKIWVFQLSDIVGKGYPPWNLTNRCGKNDGPWKMYLGFQIWDNLGIWLFNFGGVLWNKLIARTKSLKRCCWTPFFRKEARENLRGFNYISFTFTSVEMFQFDLCMFFNWLSTTNQSFNPLLEVVNLSKFPSFQGQTFPPGFRFSSL